VHKGADCDRSARFVAQKKRRVFVLRRFQTKLSYILYYLKSGFESWQKCRFDPGIKLISNVQAKDGVMPAVLILVA
jgi:hypothetical protein